MIATGYPPRSLGSNGSKETEIIDVEASYFNCTKVKPFPINILRGASGGLINGRTPFICGGEGRNGSSLFESKYCYQLTESGSWIKDQTATLNTARSDAGKGGSVVMNKNQLVLSGGFGMSSNWNWLNSIELISPNASAKTLSVQLPVGLPSHCQVPWDSDTFMVIGGFMMSGSRIGVRAESYFINVKTNQVTKGPSLKSGRAEHSCGELEVMGKSYIVVSGGIGGENIQSTEMLDKSNVGQGWQTGKYKTVFLRICFRDISLHFRS